MPRTFLIIDGYNLMFGFGGPPRNFVQGELQRERERLLELLSAMLSDKQKQDTVVVFDSKNSPSEAASRYRVDDITVQFAGNSGCADQEIEDMISAHSAPKQILLVSSDHRLQRHAKKRKAKFIDSRDFLIHLLPAEDLLENEPTPHVSNHANVTNEGDIEYWMNVFNTGEIEELNKKNPDPRRKLQKDIDAILDEDQN